MTTTVRQGSPQFPTVSGSVPASTRDDIDVAVRILHLRKDNWVALSLRERIAIVDRLMQDFLALAPRWVAASLLAKGIAADSSYDCVS